MMRSISSLARYGDKLVFCCALVFILFAHGAVPYYSLPTLGQAVWTTGFGQSFVNQSPLAVHAINFGNPNPAPIAFGLAGAYPAGLLIALGLHPADAYAAMAAIWLAIAFFGAWRLSVLLALRGTSAVLAAVLWMSMPIIWAHSGYSMLSLGIALLPLYMLVSVQLISDKFVRREDLYIRMATFVAVTTIAVFMDGYTYVMFAVGASLLGAFYFVRAPELRSHLLRCALPITMSGFAVSYVLYMTYVGQLHVVPETLDFFRGWGVDLAFLTIPTRGMHWLWDTVGLAVVRTEQTYFGDASVFISTFSLPIISAGFAGWWHMRKKTMLATAIFMVALFGLYMALGPSVKVNSVRPDAMVAAGDLSPLMGAELALAPTGSAILSRNLPGFQQMRAAYRWLALGIVGFWVLIVLRLGDMTSARARWYWVGLVVLLIIFNLPHFDGRHRGYRDAFLRIENELVMGMGSFLHEGERVAFLPYRNDFLANYITARLNVRSFNIGGDKNLFTAKEAWPPTMKGFTMGQVDSGFADRVLLMLIRQEADVVVLPYIDMLWAAQAWPAEAEFKEELAPVLAHLDSSGLVTITETEHYAVIRLAEDYIERFYPVRAEAASTVALQAVMGAGWYDAEPTHIWSGRRAELRLPTVGGGAEGTYAAEIAFFVHGASPAREVQVIFETELDGELASYRMVLRNNELNHVLIPLTLRGGEQVVRITVPNAQSPYALSEGADPRVLGVALRAIDLVRTGKGSRIGSALRIAGFTKATSSQVGSLKASALATTRREGFLVFGPYVAFGDGEYELVVKGTADAKETAWVDIVSSQGSVTHGKFELTGKSDSASNILVSGRVVLTEPVYDLEVRLYVGKNDIVHLLGYELLPVRSGPRED
ncbi:MAG: hypothetical protein KGZ66_00355 [Selenomonadales bacterium]|nr:hypothetical protein [Selenomonadales bacterium]